LPNSVRCIYGGTFDPPHFGHLYPLQHTADILKIPHVSLLPAHIPALKSKVSSSAHRLAMTERLAQLDKRFEVDTSEIKRNTTSFTVDTLRELKQAKKQNIVFIIGQDSLCTLHKWHNWRALFDYCHLLVMVRPSQADQNNEQMASKLYTFNTGQHVLGDFVGSEMDEQSQLYLSSKLAPVNVVGQCNNSDAFMDIISNLTEGKLWLVNNSPYFCSSTFVREQLRANQDVSPYVPKSIIEYIKQHNLYQPIE